MYFVLFLKNALKNFSPKLQNIDDFYNILVAEGFKFPFFDFNSSFCVPQEDVISEPIWLDSEWCADCNAIFTSFRRKHHCRKCGNSVCHSCSPDKSKIPLYNIMTMVRVCKHCFTYLNSINEQNTSTSNSISVNTCHNNNTNQIINDNNSSNIDKFEEDLQKAIELSLNESKNQALNDSKIQNHKTINSHQFHEYPSTTFSSYESKISNYKIASPPCVNLSENKVIEEIKNNIKSEVLHNKPIEIHNGYNINNLHYYIDENNIESVLDFFYKTIQVFQQRYIELQKSNQSVICDAYLQVNIYQLIND